jgi:sugar/nucleoside kinase (ribokinase family)
MDNSAAGIVTADDIAPEYVADADVVHVNGSSLVMGEDMRAACYEMVELAADRATLVSLDPNLRPGLLRAEESREIIDPVLDHVDVVVPTADELASLTGRDAADPEAGARDLVDAGAELVAVTQGADGCLLRTAERTVRDPGFDVEVVDPTGAGDAFSAATVVGSLDGMALDELAAFANAAGAHAVTAMGPMEGLAERAAVESLVATRE